MVIEVNHVKLFYNQIGTGRAIILLHGNGEDHHIFDQMVDILKDYFTVYTMDSRGHGKSSPISEYYYDDMAEDVYQFIQMLHIEQPILYGFSDGGIVGLLLAIKHPNVLSSLMISGANLHPKGLKKKWRLVFQVLYFFLHSGQIKMMLTQPNIPTDMLHQITIPTYITAGSRDIIKKNHTRMIHQNIQDSNLKIFAHQTHSSYIRHHQAFIEYLLIVYIRNQIV